MKRSIYGFEYWIGFDLDGTLAEYNDWEGPEEIGKPIDKIIDLLLLMIVRGKQEGFKVKIFTARATFPEHKKYVKNWLKKFTKEELEITNIKDHGCRLIIDDRAISVEKNTGKILANEYLLYKIG